MKYLILVYAARPDMDATAEAAVSSQEVGEFLAEFNRELIASGEYVDARGLVPAARRVTLDVGVPVITDGPFAETQEVVAGFWMVDCDDEHRATEIATGLLHGPGPKSTVEVRPVLDESPPIDLGPACRGMIRVLRGISADRLDEATPCAEYTVGDLIDHIDRVAVGFAAMARNEPDGASGDADAANLASDWPTSVPMHVRTLGDAWHDPTAWHGPSTMDLPRETWGRIALTEMVVHGWDLATATGQKFTLPEPTLRACHDHVADFVPQAPIPALWGAPTTVPPAAPLLDHILAITGRTPALSEVDAVGPGEIRH